MKALRMLSPKGSSCDSIRLQPEEEVWFRCWRQECRPRQREPDTKSITVRTKPGVGDQGGGTGHPSQRFQGFRL